MNGIRLPIFVFVLLLLSPVYACAKNDVGCNDYFRISDTLQNPKQTEKDDNSSDKPKEAAEQTKHTTDSGATTNQGETLKDPRNLNKKYQPDTVGQPITRGQTIMINLCQAFVRDFEETGKTGEIAILARVFEHGGQQKFEFTSDAMDQARLIYYSDDVQEGTFLSFSFLPMYGPIVYNGGALDIQLCIVELDRQNKEMVTLLETIADLGAKTYVPASPGLKILNTVGQAFLASARDDKAFEYSMSLWPETDGSSMLHGPFLKTGSYVYLRRQDRKKAEPLNNKLDFSPSSGRLYWKNNTDCQDHARDKSHCKEEHPILFRDETYFVVRIDTGFTALQQTVEQGLYSTFQAFKVREDQNAAREMQNITQALNQETERLTREQAKERLNGKLDNLDAYQLKTVAEMPNKALKVRNTAREFLLGLRTEIVNNAACAGTSTTPTTAPTSATPQNDTTPPATSAVTSCPPGSLDRPTLDAILLRAATHPFFVAKADDLTYEKLKSDATWNTAITTLVLHAEAQAKL